MLRSEQVENVTELADVPLEFIGNFSKMHRQDNHHSAAAAQYTDNAFSTAPTLSFLSLMLETGQTVVIYTALYLFKLQM